ncbi:MAG: HEAT repeat domain-containing protein [Gemmatimonadales bacterium]
MRAILLLAGACAALPLPAQTLEQRIARAPDGLVRLSFAAREGVCGNGRNINWREGTNQDGWISDCDPGPVRVALEVERGTVREVRAYVGGRWRDLTRGATDLGTVSARAAGQFFLDLAERGRDVKGDLLMPALLADSITVWPELLRIAKNSSVRTSVRKQAVFWLSQEASDEATRGLAELAESERENQDVRKQAVFALSQLKNGEGIPTMIRLARTDRDPVIRKQAIFWLGQSGDPRAIEFFEEVLTRRR